MMKFCLQFILAVAASPAFAQQKLPFEFFLQCDGSEKGELLVLVKGNVFFFKKPILKFDTFENNSDALTTGVFTLRYLTNGTARSCTTKYCMITALF